MKSVRSFEGLQIVVLLLLAFVVQGESLALDIYVSVDGDAQADGSLAKPYGSLPEAVKAVRALRKEGNAEQVVIILREGRHQLDQTYQPTFPPQGKGR